MKILQIVLGLDIGRRHGGAERQGIELARQMKSMGLDVSVCVFWRCGSKTETHWLNILQQEHIHVFFASEHDQSQDFQIFNTALYSIEKQLSAGALDIIHAHHEGGALAALLLKWRGRARVVLRTTHVPTGREWGTTFIGWLCRLVFTHGLFPYGLDSEVGVSQSHANSLSERPLARILQRKPNLIYCGVPFDVYQSRAKLRSTLELPNHQVKVVGSVGRLTHQKGYKYLIEAMPHVLSVMPNVQLRLVGDGDLRAELQTYVNILRLQNNIVFVGHVYDVASVYRQLDLFVLPSLWEGVPAVLLESIASDVPVVATDIPGNHDIIKHGDSGWLVPPRDSSMLAKAIVEALSDPLGAELRAQHARLILKNFSIEVIAKRYIKLYRDLL